MAEILRQCIARDFCDRARHFDAGGSATDNDERHCGLTCGFVGNFLGIFECHQNAAANFDCVLQALQTRRQFLPLRMSKIRMPRASSDNQVIVIHFAIGHFHFFRIHVDRLNFREDHLHIFAFAQDRAHRRGNVRRGKGRGRDLIKERLKQMIIRPVDHRHPDRFAREFFGRLETAESGADNHDPWFRVHLATE